MSSSTLTLAMMVLSPLRMDTFRMYSGRPLFYFSSYQSLAECAAFSYPDGPARNPSSVQRGSVQYLSLYPGDPTTPGYPSYENSTRTDGENIPGIPSLPLSWNNAKVLLDEIESGRNRTVSLVNHGKHNLSQYMIYISLTWSV